MGVLPEFDHHLTGYVSFVYEERALSTAEQDERVHGVETATSEQHNLPRKQTAADFTTNWR
ncbi:MAG: hypothetical protein EA399_06315 [Desulfovibrionales bacterium]|nr:MAG: hypothetical protein EA399_06315 [Desulfovibrionales bacterium]